VTDKELPSYQPRSPAALASDVTFIQTAANKLLDMHRQDGRLPEGIGEAEVKEIEAVAQLDIMPAKAAAMGAMTGLVHGEALYVLWAKARNAVQMLGAVALMRLADKMDNARAPGDTRVLLKMVEWAGLPTPTEAPTSDPERLEQMTKADVTKLTDDDLQQKLMTALKKGSK
jgi:hypothetical protein